MWLQPTWETSSAPGSYTQVYMHDMKWSKPHKARDVDGLFEDEKQCESKQQWCWER